MREYRVVVRTVQGEHVIDCPDLESAELVYESVQLALDLGTVRTETRTVTCWTPQRIYQTSRG